jgi:hypothetical protein
MELKTLLLPFRFLVSLLLSPSLWLTLPLAINSAETVFFITYRGGDNSDTSSSLRRYYGLFPFLLLKTIFSCRLLPCALIDRSLHAGGSTLISGFCTILLVTACALSIWRQCWSGAGPRFISLYTLDLEGFQDFIPTTPAHQY